MRATVLALCSTLCLAPVGCNSGPRPEQITKIAVVQNVCDPRCRSWGATLYPSDAVIISSDTPEDDIRTQFFHGTFNTSADWLARLPFFSGKTDYRSNRDPQDSTWITAWTSDAERIVAIPSGQPVAVNDAPLSALERFVAFVGARAYGARYRFRANRRARLENVSALALVEYRADGCYGTCPAYVTRFFPDGRATIDVRDTVTHVAVHRRALVPFATIVNVLRIAEFTGLETRYAQHAQDTFGARLHLRYSDGFTFDSDAPDRTQWPDRFAQIADRIDQVVLDTHWTPALPPRRF